MRDFERKFASIAERSCDAAKAGYPASNGTLLTLIYDLAITMADFVQAMEPKTDAPGDSKQPGDDPHDPYHDLLADLGERASRWFVKQIMDNAHSFNSTKGR